MLHIENGRDHFWQWDLDQRLIVDNHMVEEVHFCNAMSESALVCEVREENGIRYVDVPNILLQSALCISAYAHFDCYTVVKQRFNVVERTRPDDYVYTETQVMRWQDLEQRVKDGIGYYVPNVDAEGNLSWAADNPLLPAVGTVNVKGPNGAPGEPGADGYSPTASVTKNGGTATITVTDKNGTTTATVSDGAPGKDGSDATATDVRINGTSITADGVADIPAASALSYGAAKYNNAYGIGNAGEWTGVKNNNGVPLLIRANHEEIDLRKDKYRAITPTNLDYAVKAAMCDGKGAAWTDAEKLAARERLGIGGSIDVTTLTFEEPVNSATLTFPTPKPYSTVIVQFCIPKTPEDTNNRGCTMYIYVSKQDGSEEKSMYAWINIPNIKDNRLNFVGLLSNNNGLWTWQVKGPIANDYYSNGAWTIQLPSYKNPADFIVKERPYVKKIDIGWVSSAFPAGTSITAYGVL